MSFEERVLRGVSIYTYTHLLTADCKQSARTEVKQKALRVPVAERVNSNTIRIRR